MQGEQPDKKGGDTPAGISSSAEAPRFSQSHGKKHPMISHSAVAKKQRRFEHFSRFVRIDLDIIRDNVHIVPIPAARV